MPTSSSRKSFDKPLMAYQSNSSIGKQREASSDPYYVYKEELQSKIAALTQKHTLWKKMADGKGSSNQEEFAKATKDISRSLKPAQDSLNFLRRTIDVVEQRADQFQHIDSSELLTRKKFINKSDQQIQAIRQAINASDVQARVSLTNKQSKLPRIGGTIPRPSTSSWNRENEEFLHSEQQRQQSIMHEQDANLEELGSAVENLGAVAVGINDEIDKQKVMLDDMDNAVDEAQERMNFLMRILTRFLETNDKCQISTIVILTIVLLIMIVLVFYT